MMMCCFLLVDCEMFSHEYWYVHLVWEKLLSGYVESMFACCNFEIIACICYSSWRLVQLCFQIIVLLSLDYSFCITTKFCISD